VLSTEAVSVILTCAAAGEIIATKYETGWGLNDDKPGFGWGTIQTWLVREVLLNVKD